jgi:hypothetical protein
MDPTMKPLTALIILCTLVGCQQSPPLECRVTPQLFCGPFEELAAEMGNSAREELLALPEDEYAQLHFGLGMGVRNRFGLWEDNELTRFFKDNGVDHPDNMSDPFIDGYVLYLQGKSVDMKEIIAQEVASRPVVPPEPASRPEPPEPKLGSRAATSGHKAPKEL